METDYMVTVNFKKLKMKLSFQIMGIITRMSTQNMQENYNALLSLPLVKRLMTQNKQLRKENRSLRNLICSLPEFRCSHVQAQSQAQEPEQVSRSVQLDTPVQIKTEKNVVIPMDLDNDVVIVPVEQSQNIVYTLEDDIMDLIEEEEEEASEEEEEESSEEEEEEGSEAEEEEGSEAEEDKADDTKVVEDKADDTKVAEEEGSEAEEEEEEEEEQAKEVQADDTEEAEEEVFEIDIQGTSYYTTNQQTGKIYAISGDEEVGDEVGKFEKGTAIFYKKK
jgi:hypothetical protein